MTDLTFPIDHFKKRAKELLAHVRAGDVDACVRVRRVYSDATAKPDEDLAANFGLMRAQHVVAVEHGFPSWDGITKASAIEARLAITMAHVPELNDFGIGLFGGDRKKSKAEQQAIYEKNRNDLRNSVAKIDAAVSWLRENVEPTKTINKRHTSYGLKHVAEKDIGYITNGVFIAAGIIAGFPYEVPFDSPNVPFGVSEKSLREISTRRVNPERVLKRFLPIAVEILARRGIRAHARGRAGNELVWFDDGDVRTLKIEAVEKTPFLVRLGVDHYTMMISPKIAKAIGVSGDFARHYAMAQPVRPKGEITLMPDEIEAALGWALSHDARAGTVLPPAPFERSIPDRPSAEDAWSYVWSKRAADAYRRRNEGKAA